jgi:hypothetical protein
MSTFPAVLASAYLALTLAECGEFPEGIAHGQGALRLAEAVDHPFSLVMACWFLGWLCNSAGALGDRG